MASRQQFGTLSVGNGGKFFPLEKGLKNQASPIEAEALRCALFGARRRTALRAVLLAASVLAGPLPAFASAGASGGLTLLEAPGARAASLGEAFSAVTDDVTAAAYNPAALATLTRPQTSVSYESGLVDDTFGRIDAGLRRFGVSAGYFSAGNVDLLENGVTRTVNAQRDLAASFGTADRFGPVAVGLSGKYLSSVLAETDRATAWAGDAGILYIGRHATVGAAIQNIGTKITYVSEGDPLPRVARAGVAIPLRVGRVPFSLLGEAPYFINDRAWRPAAGVEVHAGPLAFRAGYRSGTQLEGLTLGTGFSIRGLDIDYAFGFVDTLAARQRVSLVFRFDSPKTKADVDPYRRRLEDRKEAATGVRSSVTGRQRPRIRDMKW